MKTGENQHKTAQIGEGVTDSNVAWERSYKII